MAQVYLEPKMKMDFIAVQKEGEIHFIVLIICATLFFTGIALNMIDFYKYSGSTDEALEINN